MKEKLPSDAATKVKALRERTGSGMFRCKLALQCADWNVDEAEDLMRRGVTSESMQEHIRERKWQDAIDTLEGKVNALEKRVWALESGTTLDRMRDA